MVVRYTWLYIRGPTFPSQCQFRPTITCSVGRKNGSGQAGGEVHIRYEEFLINGPINEEHLEPTVLNNDSTEVLSAISLVTKPKITERNKHIEILAHHIRELVSNKIIKMYHTGTYNQRAYLLPKLVQEFFFIRLLPFYHI